MAGFFDWLFGSKEKCIKDCESFYRCCSGYKFFCSRDCEIDKKYTKLDQCPEMERIAQKKGVKVASIKDQNPFYLLKEESLDKKTVAKNNQSNQKYYLAAYDDCVRACVEQCYNEDSCRSACK